MILKDCLEIIIDNRGRNPKYYDNEAYPVIDNVMIKNNYHPNIKEATRFINQDTHDNFLRGYLEPNIPIMTLVGGGIGNVSLSIDDKSVIVQNTIGFKTKAEILDSVYLYYWFLYKHDELIQFNRGSGQPSIRKTDIENMNIELKSINYQRKVSKILSKIDEKIALNNEINNNLQELINNIFISKFANFDGYNGDYKTTDLGDIPTGWNIDNFGNVVSFSNGYGWNSKDMLDSEQINTYKVFKMGNIKIGGGINKDKTKSWISRDKCLGLEQYLSKKGDILMCMTDMKSSENPLLGHTALIDRDNEFVINQRVGLIRCNKEIKWPYIYTMTNLPFFISDIRSKAHSGVQVNLTTSGICETKMLIPDNVSLEEFYKNVIPMYEKIFVINNEVEYFEQLRDTLLPKLMNGEINLDNIEI